MTNLEKLEKIFPECVTEAQDADGNLRRAIDFEKLRQILTGELADEHESYEFNFVGKKRAHFEAYAPIKKTLRPIISESRDFDVTQNIYIEGDNLDALKLLAESYLGKVKMIYIDPPYNTGNDLIYRDDFTQDVEDYEEAERVFDEAGNRLFVNRESHGRFHSDWCAMIYSRLLIAKHFLSKDGVIFISIDDHEQANLKKICDEVFGENNFVAQVIWERAYAPINLKKHFSTSHDYLLVYAKEISRLRCQGLPRSSFSDANYKNLDNDPRGLWRSDNSSVGPAVAANIYEITTPSGRKVLPPSGRSWVFSKERFAEMLADNRIYFGENGDGVPRVKRFLSEVKQRVTPMSIWKYKEVGHSQDATKALKELFGNESVFTYPKPVELIRRCLELYSKKDSVVMDFFSGSATTAQAVMEMNSQDGGHRRFVMVQLPEETSESSEAFRAGYKTICEIGKERIRRAGDKLKAEHPDLDIGFRVFKIDSSNFKPLPKRWTIEALTDYVENIFPDRNEYDLLFETLLEMGLTLDKSFSEEELLGFKILKYDDEKVLACFESDMSAEIFRALALRQPKKILFWDASFRDSVDKINALEFFKYFAPRTEVKVL